MISCGIQCINCPYPVHLDTYSGCSHACKYCFANEKLTIKNIKPLNNAKALESFINGHRTSETKWCDWDIPLHWGANSDPFQACESEHKRSLECLKIFAESKYPFIVSTKNPVLATTEPYLSLLKECECVFQISMACSRYDKLEPGAPCFEDRLKAAAILAKNTKRVIARIQPYFVDCKREIIRNLPRMKEAGIYGVIVEGFKTKKKVKGMVKEGSRYRFPFDLLVQHNKQIRDVAHNVGLHYWSGDDGIDCLGDDTICCGTTGLDNFKPNRYTLSQIAYTPDIAVPTRAMKVKGTTRPFRSVRQSQAWELHIKDKSFVDMMNEFDNGYVEWLRDTKMRIGD